MGEKKSLWDEARVERYIKLYGDPREMKGTQTIVCSDVASKIVGEYILDVGCGMGHLCPYIKPTRYLGIDSSPGMLAKAQVFFPEHGFSEVDATVLDLPSRFDSVVSVSLFIHLSEGDARKVLERMWDRARKAIVFSMETMLTSEVIRPDGIRIRNQAVEEILETLENIGAKLELVDYFHQLYTYAMQYIIIPTQANNPLFVTSNLVSRTTVFRALKQ